MKHLRAWQDTCPRGNQVAPAPVGRNVSTLDSPTALPSDVTLGEPEAKRGRFSVLTCSTACSGHVTSASRTLTCAG